MSAFFDNCQQVKPNVLLRVITNPREPPSCPFAALRRAFFIFCFHFIVSFRLLEEHFSAKSTVPCYFTARCVPDHSLWLDLESGAQPLISRQSEPKAARAASGRLATTSVFNADKWIKMFHSPDRTTAGDIPLARTWSLLATGKQASVNAESWSRRNPTRNLHTWDQLSCQHLPGGFYITQRSEGSSAITRGDWSPATRLIQRTNESKLSVRRHRLRSCFGCMFRTLS